MSICGDCEKVPDDCFPENGECPYFEPKKPKEEVRVKGLEDLKMKPGSSRAVVELVVEVECGAWGPDCTVEQAVSQALREATQKVSNRLHEDKSMRVMEAKAVRVICPAKSHQ